jgi:hypothetical protein
MAKGSLEIVHPCTDYLFELMVNGSLNESFYNRLCVPFDDMKEG